MRKIVFAIAVALVIASVVDAQSSSSKTTTSSSSAKASSSSAAATTNSTNSTNNTNGSASSSSWNYGTTTCTKGDDTPCKAINTTWCCLYTSTKYSGSDAVETYTCSVNPDIGKNWFDNTYGDIKEELSEAYY